jgi:hypothetical protein
MVEQAPLSFIEPMYAEAVQELPDGGLWTYEAKLDGYRSLAAKRSGGALGRLHGIAHIQQGFVRCIRADIKNSIGLFRGADPTVLKPVKLDFFLARELLDVSYPTLLAEEGSVDG